MNGKFRLGTKMKKILRIIIITCLGLILINCGHKSDKKAKLKEDLKTLIVEAKPTEVVLYYKARVEPIKETNISAPRDAEVKTIYFNYGQWINKGQKLFILKSDELKKDYQEALTNFLKAKTDYHKENIKSEGLEELWKIQALSKNEYIEQKQQISQQYFNYRQAKQHLQELAEKMHNIKLSSLRDLNIEDTVAVEQALSASSGEMYILSPRDGIALYPEKAGDSKNTQRLIEGSAVEKGQDLLAIGDMSGLALHINVNEININDIKQGQQVSITGVAFPDITLHGEVKKVDVQAKPSSSGLPTFSVNIDVPQVTKEELAKIHVGMTAEVKLTITQPPSVRLPITAIIKQDNKNLVKLIEPNSGKIKMVEVVTGNTSLNEVVILKGLQPGDKIVLPD